MSISGVSGGAVVPPLLGAVGDRHDMGIAMVVPLAFFVVAWTYSLAVNFAPRYRTVADAFTHTDVGIRDVEGVPEDEEKAKVSMENVVAKSGIPTVQ